MKYYIGHLAGTKLQKTCKTFFNELSSKFNLEGVIKKERMPHITLKAAFEREYINDIETYLENFCNETCSSTFLINKFGNFGKDIIFLDTIPSEIMKITFERFLKGLRDLPNISFGEFDTPNKHLHITLMKNKELGNKFNEIQEYVSGLNLSIYSGFNNITLFKKQGNKILIHKTYPLL